MNTIDELRSLVYGPGRGTGIKIIPRHCDGDIRSQIFSLARDTLNATKFPPDEEEYRMTKHATALSELLDSKADAHSVADALTRYVQSRIEWTGRGAVE